MLKRSLRTLSQDKVDLDNISTIKELQEFLISQDIGHPKTIPGHATIVYDDGEIVFTKSGNLFGLHQLEVFGREISTKPFMKLKHIWDEKNNYVTLSNKYEHSDIYDCMKRIYGHALADGKI